MQARNNQNQAVNGWEWPHDDFLDLATSEGFFEFCNDTAFKILPFVIMINKFIPEVLELPVTTFQALAVITLSMELFIKGCNLIEDQIGHLFFNQPLANPFSFFAFPAERLPVNFTRNPFENIVMGQAPDLLDAMAYVEFQNAAANRPVEDSESDEDDPRDLMHALPGRRR